MTKHQKKVQKAEIASVETSYSRIIPSGHGQYARVLIPGGSKLVSIDSQEYRDALAKLALAVGTGKVNEWLLNLGWPQMTRTDQED